MTCRIICTVKVITPTLMGGGFGQNDDIRSSEIKGLMRYWFRAIVGSFIRHDPEKQFKQDLEILRKIEGIIFGDTSQKSSFRIIFKTKNKKITKLSHLPHKSWSKNKPLEILDPNNSLFESEILIYKLPFSEINIKNYQNFLNNLLKLTFFFGVGLRKNRFFGNIILGNEETKDIEELINDLKKFVSQILKVDGANYTTLFPLFPTFSYRDYKNNKKNYYIEKVKDNCNVDNWQSFLKRFYTQIIHKIENDNEIKFFINGDIRNSHKYSLINLSLINGEIYLSSFFHKNNGYLDSHDKYNNWYCGLEKIKKLINENGLCENEQSS